jgi:hypothetical protein
MERQIREDIEREEKKKIEKEIEAAELEKKKTRNATET